MTAAPVFTDDAVLFVEPKKASEARQPQLLRPLHAAAGRRPTLLDAPLQRDATLLGQEPPHVKT